MYSGDLGRNEAYGVATQQGIPLVETTFEDLVNRVKPGEILVALFKYGAEHSLEGCWKISTPAQHSDYKTIKGFKHVGYYAVKATILNDVPGLH